MNTRYSLVIPDPHVPYHDKHAFNAMLKLAKDLGPSLEEIVILGDFGDFYPVMSHTKHPLMTKLLVDEVEAINVVLDLFDKEFPDAKKKYLCGNHEYRLERYLCNKAPELFGVTQWDHLLRLNQRPNWLSYEYGKDQYCKVLGTDLYARHEPTGSSPKASIGNSACNMVYGHVHVVDEYMVRQPCGKQVVQFTPGFLGDMRNDRVFGYVKRQPRWKLGFAVVTAEGRSYDFEYQIVEFDQNKRFTFNGKSYK